jgi:NAD(P)-dependent dehydrogenase (short-subunit alcohol dehydrogenase family)
MTVRDLLGQTVVVIGGSAGIGLETARARAEGAGVILSGRNRGRPWYSPLVEMEFGEARRGLSEHLMVMLAVARYAGGTVRPGRHPGVHGQHRWPSSGPRLGHDRGGDGGAPGP